jgi:chromosome segregation ATPase
MAYVRTRPTSSGSVSTALVEAYRDDAGRPRQRVLANLHGMPDILSALAKLAAQRELLRKEQDRLAPEAEQAEQFYRTITTTTLAGHEYSPQQRKEIDRLMRARKRLLKRIDIIAKALATIQKDGAVIRKHCTATEAEVQPAIAKYKKDLHDAEAVALGVEAHRQRSQRKLRRLSMALDKTEFNPAFLKQLMRKL